MKKLLVFLLSVRGSFGAIALSTDGIASVGAGGASSLTVTINCAAAVLVTVLIVGANGISQTMSDGGVGNTFTLCPNPPAAFPLNNTSPSARYGCWYIKSNVGGSTGYKVTFGSNSSYSALHIACWTGAHATAPFDTGAHSAGSGTNGNDVSTSNFTTAQASELILAWGNEGAAPGMTQGSGFTLLRQDTNTGFGAAYKIAGAAGTYAGIMHMTATVVYDVFGAAFLPAAAAATSSGLSLLGAGAP